MRNLSDKHNIITTLVLIILSSIFFYKVNLIRIIVNPEWFNFDEALYGQAANGNFKELIASYRLQTHPPLYFLLIWTLEQFGANLSVLRLSSVTFAYLAVVTLYFFIYKVSNKISATVACLLLIHSPTFVSHATSIRPYMLVIFLIIIQLNYLEKAKELSKS